MKHLLLSLLALSLFSACNNPVKDKPGTDSLITSVPDNKESEPAAPVAAPIADSVPRATGDNSMTSLDWPGTYKGVLPCADCEGIETTITLAADNSFTKTMRYLGKKDAKPLESKGKFTWNAEGSKVTLPDKGDTPKQYLVGENKLIQLDLQGNRVTGALAPKYELQKTDANAEAGDITNIYWKLTELLGKTVDTATQDGKRQMHLVFDKETGRVKGFGGCNNISGAFSIEAGNRIKLSQMIATRMACPQMQTESSFLQALSKSNTYILNGKKLQLTTGKMAPLLIFEAVDNKATAQ